MELFAHSRDSLAQQLFLANLEPETFLHNASDARLAMDVIVRKYHQAKTAEEKEYFHKRLTSSAIQLHNLRYMQSEALLTFFVASAHAKEFWRFYQDGKAGARNKAVLAERIAEIENLPSSLAYGEMSARAFIQAALFSTSDIDEIDDWFWDSTVRFLADEAAFFRDANLHNLRKHGARVGLGIKMPDGLDRSAIMARLGNPPFMATSVDLGRAGATEFAFTVIALDPEHDFKVVSCGASLLKLAQTFHLECRRRKPDAPDEAWEVELDPAVFPPSLRSPRCTAVMPYNVSSVPGN